MTVDRRRLVALAASLSGFLFGYDTSIVAACLKPISLELQLDSSSVGAIVTVGLIGCVVGSMLSGLSDGSLRGRKRVIFWADSGLLVGSGLMALAPNLFTLLLGRFLVGLGIGSSANVTPLFLSELFADERESRGSEVASNVVSITCGQLCSYLVGLLLYPHWRLILGSAFVPALLQAGALWFLDGTRNEIETEVEPLHAAGGVHGASSVVSLTDLLQTQSVKVGIGLQVLQQFSGINFVMYYCPLILLGSFDGERIVLVTSLLPVGFNVVGSILSLRLVDRFGRRLLLLASLKGTIATSLTILAAFLLDARGAVLVFLLCMHVLSYSCGLGSVPWVYTSEIFSDRIRGRANSLCTTCNWASNALVAAIFVAADKGDGGQDEKGLNSAALAFGIFAVSCTAGLVVLSSPQTFPETKGFTLEEASGLID